LRAASAASGSEPGTEGSLGEIARGERWLADGDEVVLRGRCGGVELGEEGGDPVASPAGGRDLDGVDPPHEAAQPGRLVLHAADLAIVEPAEVRSDRAAGHERRLRREHRGELRPGDAVALRARHRRVDHLLRRGAVGTRLGEPGLLVVVDAEAGARPHHHQDGDEREGEPGDQPPT